MAPFRYRPDIDGLRAVSVVAVVLYHAGLGCRGGFVGVDVFFVISGYLITGLILKDLNAGTFSLGNFWQRRILRIFPAMFTMVVTVLLVGYFVLLPDAYENLAKSASSQTLMVANVRFWRDIGYFNFFSNLKPLLHTWSLAVEEQFYLVFPTILMVLHRMGRAWLLPCLLTAFFVSFGLSVAGMHWSRDATFYLLPPRAWELLAGSLIAVRPVKVARGWVREGMAMAGLLMIMTTIAMYDDSTPFPGVAAIPPVLGAVLLIVAGDAPLTSVGRLLALRPLVFVGLISYSLYLWHWPIMAFTRYTLQSMEGGSRVFALTSSVVLALLSWRFVEVPFRHRISGSNRTRVFATAALCSGLVLLVCGFISLAGGMPGRFSPEDRLNINDTTWHHSQPELSRIDPETGFNLIGPEGNEPKPRRIFIWGDSHARMCLPLYNRLAKQYGVAGLVAHRSGAMPVPRIWNGEKSRQEREDHLRWNDAVRDYLLSHDEVQDVILTARWISYPNKPIDPSAASSGSVKSPQELFAAGLDDIVRSLTAAGKTVWILQQVPEQKVNIARLTILRHHLSPRIPGEPISRQQYLSSQSIVRDIFSRVASPNVKILDPVTTSFLSDGVSRVQLGGRLLYLDGDHLSDLGAEELLAPLVRPIFQGQRSLASTESSNQVQ